MRFGPKSLALALIISRSAAFSSFHPSSIGRVQATDHVVNGLVNVIARLSYLALNARQARELLTLRRPTDCAT